MRCALRTQAASDATISELRAWADGEHGVRVSHLAVDIARNRVFVAELGNDTLGVLGIDTRAVVHGIEGLREP